MTLSLQHTRSTLSPLTAVLRARLSSALSPRLLCAGGSPVASSPSAEATELRAAACCLAAAGASRGSPDLAYKRMPTGRCCERSCLLHNF